MGYIGPKPIRLNPNILRINLKVKRKMAKPIKKRAYDSSSRKEAARLTRQAIIEAARRVFIDRGYAGTTMPAIAKAASVALDTVYATVGKKPAVFRLLIEMAISGTDREVPVEEREYVRAIRAETDATRKLRIYAAALRSIQERLAPLFRVLQGAAPLDPQLAALWGNISQRRTKNMCLFAADLAATGRLRQDLSVAKAADIIWSMNSPEFYLLLVAQRGWSPHEFEDWLADAWIQLLLEP
jgi:AcrR family transcriptional regulator